MFKLVSGPHFQTLHLRIELFVAIIHRKYHFQVFPVMQSLLSHKLWMYMKKKQKFV